MRPAGRRLGKAEALALLARGLDPGKVRPIAILGLAPGSLDPLELSLARQRASQYPERVPVIGQGLGLLAGPIRRDSRQIEAQS